ncbi:1-acyl-sn-glycerol-3-phosphate acyltransferase PLS1-like protein [Drosera capensis]
MFRRFNKTVAELLWLFDWWAGMKVELHMDPEAFHLLGKAKKTHCSFLIIEATSIGWLAGLWLRSGCLGSTVAILKKALKYLPGKLLAAQQYAISRGLPIPRNVLLSRVKGFVSAVKGMRSFVPVLYDCTVAIAKDQHQPTMLRIFKGQSSVVKVQIKRHLMHELPETNDGISQWCKDAFVNKDAFLENYFTSGKFSNLESQDIGRPRKPLIVIVWLCLLTAGVVGFLRWTSLFSTWQGIALTAVFLVKQMLSCSLVLCLVVIFFINSSKYCGNCNIINSSKYCGNCNISCNTSRNCCININSFKIVLPL